MKDGLAFCAIISRFRSDLIDFNLIKPNKPLIKLKLAFDLMRHELEFQIDTTPEEVLYSTNIQLNESLTLRAQFKSDHYNAKQLNTFQANNNNSNSIGNTNYTKIFDNSFQSQDSFMIVNQQANKDQITNQLFAVESTII